MPSYYDSNKATSANSRNFILNDSEEQHFPFEGLYIGSLTGGEMELPALVDICEVKAFCMLYNSEATRTQVNHVLEKLAGVYVLMSWDEGYAFEEKSEKEPSS